MGLGQPPQVSNEREQRGHEKHTAKAGVGGGEGTRVPLLPQSHVNGSGRKLGTYPKERWKTRLYYQTTKIRGSLVEVTHRFKGLDLIDRVPEELWTEVHNIVQETGSKTIAKKRNAERQNGCLRRPYK